MNERVDAVVIGAGLGGLGAAVSLAGAGRRVLVLEHHTLPGGYAQGFERGPFRFDVSLHALNGLAPGGGGDAILRELGVWDSLAFSRLDPLYLARFPEHEVTAPADIYAYESELARAFPAELAGIRSYLDECRAVYRDQRRLEVDTAGGGEPDPAGFADRYPHLVRVAGETWEQLIDRHIADPRLRCVLGAYSGYLGLPPSRCAAMLGTGVTGSYHEHGGWYPHGGSLAVSRALERVLRERGSDIRYGERVTNVVIEAGRATGVRTNTGLDVSADLVISNASAPTTMLELVGREHLPAEYVARVEHPKPSYTTFAVYLGLSRDVFAEHGLPHEVFVYDGYDQDATWDASLRGDWSRASLVISDYTRVDPGCAPTGWAAVVITAVAPWDYEDVWGTGGDLTHYHGNTRYLELKERVADLLVARADDHVPGLIAATRHGEASSPLTNFEYTRNPLGAIEGYENTPANSGLGWLPAENPIANLLLTGAWTNSGGQIPALASGLHAAHLAQRMTASA
jgi:phytoene dehydrogenase-like protein